MQQQQELLGYQQVTLISKRRFNSLFLAHTETQPSQEIAIKMFDALSLDDPQEQQSFLLEIEKVKALNHPAILPIYGSGMDENHPYIISEYLANGSLHFRSQQSRFSLESALEIIQQIGNALISAHAQQIVHGNIKSENILLNQKNKAFLMDFSSTIIHQKMITLGYRPHYRTLAYMAPETFRQDHTSAETDQYALACLAFELLIGSVPFPAATYATSQKKHRFEALPSMKSVVPTLPDHIELAIHKAMAKQPENRYEDIEAFLDALVIPQALYKEVTQEEALRSMIALTAIDMNSGELSTKQISASNATENISKVQEFLQDPVGTALIPVQDKNIYYQQKKSLLMFTKPGRLFSRNKLLPRHTMIIILASILIFFTVFLPLSIFFSHTQKNHITQLDAKPSAVQETKNPQRITLPAQSSLPTSRPTLIPQPTSTPPPQPTPTLSPVLQPMPTTAPPSIVHLTIVDNLNNWNNVYSHTNGLSFDQNNSQYMLGDTSLLYRLATTSEEVIWHLPQMTSFTAVTYFWPGEPVSPFSISISTDGVNWQSVSPTITANYPPGSSWHQFTYNMKNLSNIAFVKIHWNNLQGQAWSPQIGSMTLQS